jgi:hypothetical protein
MRGARYEAAAIKSLMEKLPASARNVKRIYDSGCVYAVKICYVIEYKMVCINGMKIAAQNA